MFKIGSEYLQMKCFDDLMLRIYLNLIGVDKWEEVSKKHTIAR